MTTLAMTVPTNPSPSTMNSPPMPQFSPALLPHPLLYITFALTLAPMPVPPQGGSLFKSDKHDEDFEKEEDMESLI